jgi:hypothetical protein
MTPPISFRCPGCKARIKAPVQLAGQRRSCPGCGHNLLVPRKIPQDAEPVLVVVDEGGPSLRVRPW